MSSYFDLTDHEREAMNVMLRYVKRVVDECFHPDGYNIGINVGQAAGQSVYHCHMHLIHDMPATWKTRWVESGELYQRNRSIGNGEYRGEWCGTITNELHLVSIAMHCCCECY